MNNNGNLPRQLQQYINNELHDAQLYRILAKSAPSERERRILDDFSADSKNTADALMTAYRTMTGYTFEPHPEPIKENGSYRSVLKSRIREETSASRNYRRHYMNTNDNLKLKRTFFNAYHNALEHAVGIVEMLMNVERS